EHERAGEVRSRGLQAVLESRQAIRLDAYGYHLRWCLQPGGAGKPAELVVASGALHDLPDRARVVRCDLSGAVIARTELRAVHIDVIGPARPEDEGVLCGGRVPTPGRETDPQDPGTPHLRWIGRDGRTREVRLDVPREAPRGGVTALGRSPDGLLAVIGLRSGWLGFAAWQELTGSAQPKIEWRDASAFTGSADPSAATPRGEWDDIR